MSGPLELFFLVEGNNPRPKEKIGFSISIKQSIPELKTEPSVITLTLAADLVLLDGPFKSSATTHSPNAEGDQIYTIVASPQHDKAWVQQFLVDASALTQTSRIGLWFDFYFPPGYISRGYVLYQLQPDSKGNILVEPLFLPPDGVEMEPTKIAPTRPYIVPPPADISQQDVRATNEALGAVESTPDPKLTLVPNPTYTPQP
jgi:hypothetical protein